MEKKVIVVLLVFAFCSVSSFGLSLMGPPKAELDEGQYRIGVDYSYSENNLDINASVTIDDVETNMVFANLGYGITEQWEGFVRLGVTRLKVEDFDGDGEFAYGFGAKVTLIEGEAIAGGGLFQIIWFETDNSESGIDIDIDAFEIQIAIGPTYEAENMRFYGGPFLHLFDGDGNLSGTVPGFGSVSGSFDIEQVSEFGGYVGTQIDIADNSAVNVELQFTGDAWAVGAGIGWRY